MKKFILISLTALLAATSFAQGHFTVAFTGNGQDHMNLNILTATIDGVALQAGDEIAAFDGTICCGKVVLSQPINIADMNTFVAIAVSKSDEGLSNGYTAGNTISYKIWDSSINQEIFLIISDYIDPSTALSTTASKFTANASASVKLIGRINKAPAAKAGADQTVNENLKVTLDGSASSDPDNDVLTYSWTAPSGITLSSTTVAMPTFNSTEVASDTPYTFSLVVNDGLANSSTDQVTVTIKQVNKVPVANAGNDQKVYEGLSGTLNALASSDGDGNTLTYSWTAPIGITLSSTTAAMPTFKAPEVSKDTQYTFGLVVNDGIANSLVNQVIITVAQTHFDVAYSGNGQDHMNLNIMKATFDGVALEAGDEIAVFDNTICCGKVVLTDSINTNDFNTFVTIDASKKDDELLNGYSEGNTITYLFWDASKSVEKKFIVAQYMNQSTSQAITSPQFTANASAFVKLTGITNSAPVAIAGSDMTNYKGETVTLDGSASTDSNNDPLTYKWTAPSGIVLSSMTSPKPTFVAPNVTKDTIYTFSLVVNDGKEDSPEDQIKVTIKRKIYTQNIKLITGWNMISINVTPSVTNLKDIFQPLINKGTLVKVMDESGKSIENFKAFGGWINNIGNFNETEGYRVYVNGPDTLKLEGEAIKLPMNIPLVSGWNIISYPCADAQNALTMVQPLIDSGLLKKVMDETGNSIENFKSFGGWKNNIGNFLPGKGYKIFMNGAVTFTMSSTLLRSANLATVPRIMMSNYFVKNYEGNGSDHMNINIVGLESSIIQEGDEIGLFDGTVCVGSAAIGSEQIAEGYISIPTSFNDGLEETVNGFIPGNCIAAKLYRSGLSYDLQIDTLMGSDIFEKNGSLFVEVKSKSPSKNQVIKQQSTTDKVNIKCYPNPFVEEVSIDVENTYNTAITIEIYSITGQKMKQLYKGETDSAQFKWDGTDENGNKVIPGVYLCKVNNSLNKIVRTGNK